MERQIREEARREAQNRVASASGELEKKGLRLPDLTWDIGTAYDLFGSLYVLHHPDDFGLRASWAAGVRSRLDAEERKTLEDAQTVMGVPLVWIHSLPEPKDGATALWALRQEPADQRLINLVFCGVREEHSKTEKVFRQVAERKAWNEEDLEAVQEVWRKEHWHKEKVDKLPRILDIYANAADFGERLLKALQSYHQVYFSEEERRIKPELEAGLARAQALSEKMSLPELIEKLSQGVTLPANQDLSELILAPSYWSTPIIFFDEFSEDRVIMAFGVRPSNASLVPGELVPDGLLKILKAVADPTRLRILRFLTQEPLTPAEVARRLRLRPPTVTHHLSALRLAGLVHLHFEEGERQYTARLEALEGLYDLILDFLWSKGGEEEPEKT